MPTSVPNFNFLALLVSEIWRGPEVKSGGADLPDAPNRQIFTRSPQPEIFLHGAWVPANAYQLTKLQLRSSISFGDMEAVPK